MKILPGRLEGRALVPPVRLCPAGQHRAQLHAENQAGRVPPAGGVGDPGGHCVQEQGCVHGAADVSLFLRGFWSCNHVRSVKRSALLLLPSDFGYYCRCQPILLKHLNKFLQSFIFVPHIAFNPN